MVIEKEGDIFATQYALRIQGVNTRGIIGGGISGAFLRHYPGLHTEYTRVCFTNSPNELIGKVHLYADTEGKWTGLAFTQIEPGPNAKLNYIRRVLDQTMGYCEQFVSSGLTEAAEFAMPAIGCGIGGLAWEDVLTTVHNKCDEWPGTCYIYKPWEA